MEELVGFSEDINLSLSPIFLGLPETAANRSQADKWWKKAEEGGRDQEVHKLRIEIESHKQNLLKLDQQRFLSGEMDADSYKRLKSHINLSFRAI